MQGKKSTISQSNALLEDESLDWNLAWTNGTNTLGEKGYLIIEVYKTYWHSFLITGLSSNKSKSAKSSMACRCTFRKFSNEIEMKKLNFVYLAKYE